ncbi:hypothetical protein Pint_22695 [Pistacia integerrima]|uniref:Uncharacterized protein n=1 Tax=Pistacia integerrima TaxID=434235 RepID=A0ACC0YMX1_9ROSI|nr:hypothetical protein Pint_22695 [Pistacia integerrima]
MLLLCINLQALDTFKTSVISPVYYVTFTSLTILASMIMFKDWDSQNASQIVTQLCGFVTIIYGTFLLHRSRDLESKPESESPVIAAPHPRPNSSKV